MKKLICVSLLSICCLSCTKTTDKTVIKNAELIGTITALNDSLFFGAIVDIESANNHYYLSDLGTNQLIVVDSNFNYIRSIGRSGPGPEEIKGIGSIEILNDKIAIQDAAGMKILFYDTAGTFLSANKAFFNMSEFALGDSSMIGQVFGEVKNPLAKYSLRTLQKTSFGLDSDKRWGYPSKHVKLIDSLIITVNKLNLPAFFIYDLKGNFLKSTDLSNHPLISPWYNDLDIENMVKNNTPMSGTSQIVFADISTLNNKLYLHMPPLGRKNGPKQTFVFEAQFDDQLNVSIVKGFLFKSNHLFTSFTISPDGNYIIAFDQALGGILKFKLNE